VRKDEKLGKRARKRASAKNCGHLRAREEDRNKVIRQGSTPSKVSVKSLFWLSRATMKNMVGVPAVAMLSAEPAHGVRELVVAHTFESTRESDSADCSVKRSGAGQKISKLSSMSGALATYALIDCVLSNATGASPK